MKQAVTSIFLGYWFYCFVSFLLVITLFCLSHQQKTDIKKENYACLVKRVVDGDTLIALCRGFSKKALRVRLLHIDTPEISQPIWGKRSTQFLRHLIREAKSKVDITFRGVGTYHRHLGIIRIAGKDINYLMVKKGLAVSYRRYHPPQNYLQAMQSAKRKKLGIWRHPGLQQNPQRYRRLSH